MNAVEGDIPTEEEQLQCVELSRVWNLCAVTRQETPIGNSFEALREEEEDISSVPELIEVEEDYNLQLLRGPTGNRLLGRRRGDVIMCVFAMVVAERMCHYNLWRRGRRLIKLR